MAKEEEEEEMTCWIFSQFFDGRQNPFYMTTFAFVCRVLFLIVGCDAVGGGDASVPMLISVGPSRGDWEKWMKADMMEAMARERRHFRVKEEENIKKIKINTHRKKGKKKRSEE